MVDVQCDRVGHESLAGLVCVVMEHARLVEGRQERTGVSQPDVNWKPCPRREKCMVTEHDRMRGPREV